MKSISSKTLKIISALSWVFYVLIFAMAYFSLLDINICSYSMIVLFAIDVVVEFILSYRKIKENKAKDDNQNETKSFGIIIRIILSYVWRLFVAVWLIVLLLKVITLAEIFG